MKLNSAISRNRYSFCHLDGKLEHFKDASELKQIYAGYEYITSVAVEFEKILPDAGLELVTTWSCNRAPTFDPACTILIVVGDERAQVPNGARTVRLLFRTGAPKTPWPVMQPLQRPLSLFLFSTVREIRNIGLRIKRWAEKQAPLLTPANVECVPIGFVGNIQVKSEEMSLRTWDVSFAGGVGRHVKLGKQRLPLCAKASARLSMLEGLEELSRISPSLRTQVICSDLNPRAALTKDAYHELLRQTKISLCSRGNFVETFRLYESACLGCVIFTDPLPRAWYFENHPFIEVHDWRKFAPKALALLSDPPEMERLGNLSRKWWVEVASPQAVANKIAQQILLTQNS